MAGKGFDSFDMQGYSSYHSGGPPSAGARNMSNERSRLVQIISTNIHKMTQNVDQMNRLIGQIGSPTDTLDLHDKLHQVQHYTNQLAKETNQCIKDLSHIPITGTSSEQRERRLQQERLVNSFTTALNSFQQAQRKQKDKESTSSHAMRGGIHGFEPFGASQTDSDKLISIENTLPATQQQQQLQQELDDDDEDEELLRDREQSIRKLESDIMDVNQIFKDLSLLVHEQSDVIDSIEANVERSALNVERGTEQLLQARNYQSKVRKRKLCLLVIVLVVIAILAIIIGVSVSNR